MENSELIQDNSRFDEPLASTSLPPATSYEGPARSWSDENRTTSDAESLRTQRVARALGWFSIGLGIVELAAPKTVARLSGIRACSGVVRAFGVREIVTGVGILRGRKPAGWLWSRVAGDALDLAVLTTAGGRSNGALCRIAATTAVASVTAVDVQVARQLSNGRDEAAPEKRAVELTQTIIINCPPETVYRFWRDFENLPRVMSHLDAVEYISDSRSRWRAKGPAGKRIQWEAEMTEDRPNERISWRSLPNSMVDNAGSVTFAEAPGGRGTLLRVSFHYDPPAGDLGVTIAKLFGREPTIQLKDDLRRLRQMLETGDVVTTEGQPAGRRSSQSWKYDRLARQLANAY